MLPPSPPSAGAALAWSNQPASRWITAATSMWRMTGYLSAPVPIPSKVFVYAAGSNGNVAPIATIRGPDTGLYSPEGVTLDSKGNIYVADADAASVFVYRAGSNGDAAPIATISGSNTGLSYPYGIALDSSGNIYVTGEIAASVFVYSALGSSTGLLNEAPIATISGSNTGLDFPQGIAVDSSGNIYVADRGDSSAFPPIPRPCLSILRGATATRPPPPPSAVHTQNWVLLCSSPSSRWLAPRRRWLRPRRRSSSAASMRPGPASPRK